MTRKKLLILSGAGDMSIVAANRYMRMLPEHFDVTLIEEQPDFLGRLWVFMKRRTRTAGVISMLGALALRAYLLVFGSTSLREEKQYRPDHVVGSVNDASVAEWIETHRPDIIMANACLLIREPVLSAAKGIPMFNLHNGINPRYRGNGNFWAFYEGNEGLVGITIHHIDSGVDTGDRVIVKELDFKGDRVPFDEIDVYAFAKGAEAMMAHLIDGVRSIPPQLERLNDRAYRTATLWDYWHARKRYRRWMQTQRQAEDVWRESFETQAGDENKSIYQRMHWHDDATVKARDVWVRDVIERSYPAKPSAVLDIGCGDGRAQHWFEDGVYTGVDYSPKTLGLGEGVPSLVAASADSLPVRDHSQSLVFSVGLIQHLDHVQVVCDEMVRVCDPDGVIIINTLRQFSKLELLVIAGLSFYNLSRLKLVYHIWCKDYGQNIVLDGVLLARRTNRAELAKLFQCHPSQITLSYNGVWNTALMARELTAVIRPSALHKRGVQ